MFSVKRAFWGNVNRLQESNICECWLIMAWQMLPRGGDWLLAPAAAFKCSAELYWNSVRYDPKRQTLQRAEQEETSSRPGLRRRILLTHEPMQQMKNETKPYVLISKLVRINGPCFIWMKLIILDLLKSHNCIGSSSAKQSAGILIVLSMKKSRNATAATKRFASDDNSCKFCVSGPSAAPQQAKTVCPHAVSSAEWMNICP